MSDLNKLNTELREAFDAILEAKGHACNINNNDLYDRLDDIESYLKDAMDECM